MKSFKILVEKYNSISLITTLIAAFVAVIASFIFPQTMILAEEVGEQTSPGGNLWNCSEKGCVG